MSYVPHMAPVAFVTFLLEGAFMALQFGADFLEVLFDHGHVFVVGLFRGSLAHGFSPSVFRDGYVVTQGVGPVPGNAVVVGVGVSPGFVDSLMVEAVEAACGHGAGCPLVRQAVVGYLVHQGIGLGGFFPAVYLEAVAGVEDAVLDFFSAGVPGSSGFNAAGHGLVLSVITGCSCCNACSSSTACPQKWVAVTSGNDRRISGGKCGVLEREAFRRRNSHIFAGDRNCLVIPWGCDCHIFASTQQLCGTSLGGVLHDIST